MRAPVGCGIGGLDWADVRDVLSDIGHERDHIELVAVTWEQTGAS
jgi:hypothetical protein